MQQMASDRALLETLSCCIPLRYRKEQSSVSDTKKEQRVGFFNYVLFWYRVGTEIHKSVKTDIPPSNWLVHTWVNLWTVILGLPSHKTTKLLFSLVLVIIYNFNLFNLFLATIITILVAIISFLALEVTIKGFLLSRKSIILWSICSSSLSYCLFDNKAEPTMSYFFSFCSTTRILLYWLYCLRLSLKCCQFE